MDGAHSAAPSRVRRGEATVALDRVIALNPTGELGAATLRRFGPRLPFLLKPLAADAPLSLQGHPDLAQTRAGYERENELGIPLNAPHRAVTEAVTVATGLYGSEIAAYAGIARAHPADAGLLPALMLRYAELEPGEALFLGAGVPHAYLSGLGVEVMAGSDNVLRCGLTSKHVDPAELLRVVRFASRPAGVLTPCDEGGEEVYQAPVDDFRLSRIRLRTGASPRKLALDAPQIVLCTEGDLSVTSAGRTLHIGPGHSVYLPAGAEAALSGHGTAFRATTGEAREPRSAPARQA